MKDDKTIKESGTIENSPFVEIVIPDIKIRKATVKVEGKNFAGTISSLEIELSNTNLKEILKVRENLSRHL